MSQANEINGELFKLRREERGWAQSDMATRACMSVKQIRQIEEGGVSAFYSESVKVSAAKKVAGLLGLSSEQIWLAPAIQTVEESVSVEHAETAVEVHVEQQAEQHVEPEAQAKEAESAVQEEATQPATEAVVSQAADQTTSSIPEDKQAKPKTSLWLIAALFGAALAVAAYMRPDAEPVATEPPPPLQAVPSEAADPASSASAAVEAASMPASVPASAPISASSAPAVAASKPASAIAPASAAKPVLPASVAAPVASAASK